MITEENDSDPLVNCTIICSKTELGSSRLRAGVYQRPLETEGRAGKTFEPERL